MESGDGAGLYGQHTLVLKWEQVCGLDLCILAWCFSITMISASCSAVPWPLCGGLCSSLLNNQRGRRFM